MKELYALYYTIPNTTNTLLYRCNMTLSEANAECTTIRILYTHTAAHDMAPQLQSNGRMYQS